MEALLTELEILILNNEDDFDRGKGKFILIDFIIKKRIKLKIDIMKLIIINSIVYGITKSQLNDINKFKKDNFGCSCITEQVYLDENKKGYKLIGPIEYYFN